MKVAVGVGVKVVLSGFKTNENAVFGFDACVKLGVPNQTIRPEINNSNAIAQGRNAGRGWVIDFGVIPLEINCLLGFLGFGLWRNRLTAQCMPFRAL